jgi:hypothetical protein
VALQDAASARGAVVGLTASAGRRRRASQFPPPSFVTSVEELASIPDISGADCWLGLLAGLRFLSQMDTDRYTYTER